MTKAVTKYVRMSPRKVRRVIDEIRGKSTKEATTLLKFMTYAAAPVVSKTLKSAIANATQNDKLNPDNLKITKAFVDQSVTLKRWRPMSKGRAFPILKRSSHITIEVNEGDSLAKSEVKDIAKKAAKKSAKPKASVEKKTETSESKASKKPKKSGKEKK